MLPPVLPCNLPCPRCGTSAVTRRYDHAGEAKDAISRKLAKLLEQRFLWSVSNSVPGRNDGPKLDAEIDACRVEFEKAPDLPRIQNTCMICKYNWDSEPLSKGAA